MNALGEIAPIFNVVMLVVVLVVGAWTTTQQGTIKTLRESNIDLRARIGDLEATSAIRDAKLEHAEKENEVLRTVVGGEVHWTALTDQLDMHHREATGHWDVTQSLLNNVLNGIEGLTDEIRRERESREGGRP